MKVAINAQEGFVHIGELADRTGLSLRTLRHYDEVGLLRPSGRTDGGFRVYSEDDFTRLTLIRQARALKFSLEEISELLDVLSVRSGHHGYHGYHGYLTLDAMATLLEEAYVRRTKLATDLDRADAFITHLSTRIHQSTLGAEPHPIQRCPSPQLG